MPATKAKGSGTRVIRLPRGEWSYDPARMLGKPGGFGAVFEGSSEEFGAVAVKKLHKGAGELAHREMKIADELAGKSFTNVIPVLDAGQDADSSELFVVMPRADHSLRQAIKSDASYTSSQAASIILSIVKGLLEVNDIVHRDLKPENVLLLNGNWSVADFGIARFVEEATSLNTLKGCLTPTYAAPEQWNLEHATSASDIYSLGCIAYELLAGKPPFAGDEASLKQKQCAVNPDPLPESVAPQLRSLVTMMLRKAPSARPSTMRVKQQLEAILENEAAGEASPPCLHQLGEAAAVAAKAEADREAATQRAYKETEQRQQLRTEAESILTKQLEDLVKVIGANAPNADIRKLGDGSFTVQISTGKFSMTCSRRDIPAGKFSRSKWEVVASGKLMVSQPTYNWSTSLWYAKLPNTDDYRWYEVGYFSNPMLSGRATFEPFAVDDLDIADEAAAPMLSLIQFAFGPEPIDDEHADSFRQRWIRLFTKACNGQLDRPRQLPIPPGSL